MTYPAGSASIEIHPSLKGFRGELKRELERVQVDYRVDVHANTSYLAREIETFRRTQENRPIEIPVKYDTKALESFKKSLAGAVLPNLGALAIGNLPAAATAVASLGSAVADLSGTALLLPAAFAGIGAAVSTLTVGMQGMKDAFEDGEKGAEAFAKLSTNAQNTVTTLKGFKDEWEDLRKSVQDNLFDGVGASLDKLVSTQLPRLKSGMQDVSASLNRGILTASSELGSTASQGAMDQLFGNTAVAVDRLNGSVAPLIGSFRILATTGSEFLPQLAQGFTNLSNRLEGFLQRTQASGDLSRWMQEGIDSAKTLGSILENLGSSLSGIIRATGDDGQTMLETFDRLTERLAAFLNSTEGQAKLETFFAEGKDQLAQWLPILEDMGPVLRSVMDAAQAWSDILMPFLRAAADLLADHPGLVQAAIGAYLGFKTMAPILDGLRLATGGIATGFDAMKRGAADAAGAGGLGKLGGAAGGLMGLFAAGGPWGIALGAGAAAIGILTTAHQNAAERAREHEQRERELQSTLDANTGRVTEQTLGTIAKDFQERGVLDRAESFGVDTQALVRGSAGIDEASRARITAQLAQQIQSNLGPAATGRTGQQIRDAGISESQLAQALAGDRAAIDLYNVAMDAYAQKNQTAKISLEGLRDVMPDAAESASVLGNELNGTGEAMGNAGARAQQLTAATQGTFALTEQGTQAFRDLGVAVRDVPDSKTVVVDAPTEDQKRRLEELGYQVTNMPDGSVEVTLNDQQAKDQITELIKPRTMTVNVTANFDANARTAYFGAPNVQGPTPIGTVTRADGGGIYGGIPGRDSVPAMLMPGEHVLTTQDVLAMGGQAAVYDFRRALHMASGGAVTDPNGDVLTPIQLSIWDEIKRRFPSAILTDGPRPGANDFHGQGKAIDVAGPMAEMNAYWAQAHPNALELFYDPGVNLDEGRRIGPIGGHGDHMHIADDGTSAGGSLSASVTTSPGSSGSTTGTRDVLYPQAGLPGRMSDSEISALDAQASVDAANSERNRIYADPNATDADRAKADRAYLSAQNRLESTQQSGEGGLPPELSAQAIGARAGTILAEGVLDFFGLGNSILSSSNVYNQAINKTITALDERQRNKTPQGAYGYTPQNLPGRETYTIPGDNSSTMPGVPGAPSSAAPSGDPIQSAFARYGWGDGDQWAAAQWIIGKESGGNPQARNPQSGAYGIGQFLGHENDKYGAMGAYSDDPYLQSSAMAEYIRDRYGDPIRAKQFWEANGWYRDGGKIRGRGGPRDDANLVHASNGEQIVNAFSADAAPALLDAVNSSPSLAGELDAQFRRSAEWRTGGVPFGGPTLAGGGGAGSVTNFTFPGVRVANVEDLVELGERKAAMASIGALAAAPR